VQKHLDIRAVGAFEGLRADGRVEASDLAISGSFRCAMFFAAGSVLEDSTLTGVSKNGSAPLCLDAYSGVTFRRLSINDPAGTGLLLEFGGSVLEDSTISAKTALQLMNAPGEATIRRVSLFGTDRGLSTLQSARGVVSDSVITSSGGTAAVSTMATNTHLRLRSDTVVATGAGAAGIEVGSATSSLAAGQTDLRNVIVDAAGPDLRALVDPNPASCTPAPCAPGNLSVDHSAFADSEGPVSDGGSNVAAPPAFVDAAGLDFHLAPASPAIDAGLVDDSTQGTDRDGHTRVQGAGLDLGAYETTPASVAPTPPAATDPAPAQPAPAQPALARDLRAPVLSNVRVAKRVFRYRLSEAATVKIDLARRSAAKRYRHMTTLTRTGHSGDNSTKPRTLKPGSYRATLTARDAAGNTSRKVVVKFSVKP
jgi:hypothetical protein